MKDIFAEMQAVCKPPILQGLQKISKISTHLLTVLITGAILHIEQREQVKHREICDLPVPKYHSPSGSDHINILFVERRNDL